MIRHGALLLAFLALGGCYRPAPPAAIEETVRLEFVANDGRFVRAQGYLAEEIADALVRRNGWRVGPQGTARLAITLHEERLRAAGRSDDDVVQQQRVRLRGTALLTTRSGSLSSDFSGETIISSVGDEPEALRGAAKACATSIVEWLAIRADDLKPAPAP